jgi:hypothetical protein
MFASLRLAWLGPLPPCGGPEVLSPRRRGVGAFPLGAPPTRGRISVRGVLRSWTSQLSAGFADLSMPNVVTARKTPWRRVATVLAALIPAPLLVQPGCGSTSTACVPGQSVSCVGSQPCSDAFQVCKADGTGYDECRCPEDDGGKGSFPPVGPNSGLLGAACDSDSNCRRGLECVRSSAAFMVGEGPSSGMCVARCVPGSDICSAVDGRAKCKVLDDRGTPTVDDDVAYCFAGCSIGADTKDSDKCRSRSDVVCREDPKDSGEGICIPACRGDIDCRPRFCNLATGLCSDAAPVGLPLGAACNPNATECAGVCIPHLASYAECSGICSYGEPGCGETRTSPPYDYFCYTDEARGSGAGDLGYCTKVCNCDADCDRADAVCEPAPDLASKTGRSGICGSRLLPGGTPRSNRPCAP